MRPYGSSPGSARGAGPGRLSAIGRAEPPPNRFRPTPTSAATPAGDSPDEADAAVAADSAAAAGDSAEPAPAETSLALEEAGMAGADALPDAVRKPGDAAPTAGVAAATMTLARVAALEARDRPAPTDPSPPIPFSAAISSAITTL